MRLAVLQPSYLPWLGYFDQVARSDVFVIYDDVQFDKHGWRNRNRIKTAQGWQWITVPVLHRGQNRPSNRDISINNGERWAHRHSAAIRTNYGRAVYFERYFPWLSSVLDRPWERLLDLNLELLRGLCAELGIQTKLVLSSELGVSGERTERLVEICRMFGADRYLSGSAARDYLDVSAFTAHGITVEWHDYEHPVYRQLFGEFVSHLSIVDVLFNCGEESRRILVNQRSEAA